VVLLGIIMHALVACTGRGHGGGYWGGGSSFFHLLPPVYRYIVVSIIQLAEPKTPD